MLHQDSQSVFISILSLIQIKLNVKFILFIYQIHSFMHSCSLIPITLYYFRVYNHVPRVQ